ncbi:nitrate reductase cytochrome c-type subunit (NapB) [Ferrimonas balearica DSM 9799]|uniref:Periplasmic nitrate reductase, electron transfer subunit n=1 Tax=Ferrimonas balearica (strain DSM 9799 / CCM 4581 / KCTC 23876 / PAT) TaxID=550540 RepID=E1SPK3_FERBD|nr:nitrate reductase cytochrome c-type subunit [Ferrimonas balearica]MBY6019632.1 nitrate reductase cytochrome c-type subunit [Halomonas denitrificans]ADN77820.1 nitrate reductase cytochrome c-type subunit (NapB) [Ferrimonas balearica DSM 9799]MBW3141481.1 nitrate reductase cytochrome c-type subunit [Ferrimonas balearica]MBY5982241.1 nitrate reductase cytochrome c-type subunit [Ferrimonas balearica]MBY6096698.1 nitrate reductase cytochrome c-type subunit [Ferrimonas balearica]
MKKTLSLITLVLALAGCQSGGEPSQSAPESMRGAVPVAEMSPVAPLPQYPAKGTSVERSVIAQPPVIPHKADYPINLDKNSCINCHRGGKHKMAATHFEGRKVAGQYYQCRACHVPQAVNF